MLAVKPDMYPPAPLRSCGRFSTRTSRCARDPWRSPCSIWPTLEWADHRGGRTTPFGAGRGPSGPWRSFDGSSPGEARADCQPVVVDDRPGRLVHRLHGRRNRAARMRLNPRINASTANPVIPATSAPVRARALPPPLATLPLSRPLPAAPPLVGPPPDGAMTVRLAIATRDRSALETTMAWAPTVVLAGIVTVATTCPAGSAATVPRLTGLLHSVKLSGSPDVKPSLVRLVSPPA